MRAKTLENKDSDGVGVQQLYKIFPAGRGPYLKPWAGVEAVIFDLDGVLVNSEPKMIAAEMFILKQEFGRDFSLQRYHKEVKGKGLEGKKTYFSEKFFPDPVERAAFLKRFQYIHDNEHLHIEESDAMDGVKELLDYLVAHNIPIAVASNSRRANIYEKLKRTKLLDYFGGHYYSYEDTPAQKAKPAPDLPLFVAKKLGKDPQNCTFIDDSKNGILGAIQAKMLSIGYADKKLQKQGADFTVEQMKDLKQLVIQILPISLQNTAKPSII